MKRALVVGVTLATTAATTLVAASGASAVPPPSAAPECATYNDSTTAISALVESSNWYATCTPQYGMGKVEFTISSATDFPAGFKNLDDAAVTKTINENSAAVSAYIGGSISNYGLNALQRIDDGSNPRQQRYRVGSNIGVCSAGVVGVSVCSLSTSVVHPASVGASGVLPFHISSVSSISPTELPAAVCGNPADYTNAYKLVFDPVKMTFTQMVDSEQWRFVVNIAPHALYLGFSPDFTSHTIASGTKFCKSQGSFNAVVDSITSGSPLAPTSIVSPATPFDISYWTAYLSLIMQNPYQASFTQNDVGDFAAEVTLPNTGAPDARIPLTAGASLLVLGLAVSLISRRRLRRARSPRA